MTPDDPGGPRSLERAEGVARLDNARLEALLRLSQMTSASLDEIASFTLEQAVRLTGSDLGYVAFTSEDETVLTMHAWSTGAMRQCRTKEIPRTFVVAETGLWGEPIRQRRVVITNDYAAPNPLKKGTPDGHVAVRRHMGVPVFDDERVVIVAGVANKAEDYDEGDVRQIALLMGGMWQILKRQRAEEERQKLQERLNQAQKMESIGRLAGGVAHEFNNSLLAILGNAAILLEEVPGDSPLREGLEEIQRSAERSANLTRQLLGFARQQTIDPQAIDLNDAVTGLLRMLHRLLGEDIDLHWKPGTALWPVRMDASQLDQILTSLVISAREAIGGPGKVIVETSNVTLEGPFSDGRADYRPGDYVLLAVSDTGPGLDAEARARVFEPFFTPRPGAQATGLGLAAVLGIVKQNEGLINVYSEPGRGTTIKIYLPRAGATASTRPAAERPAPGGGETLLLVEDEEQVLRLGQRLLERRGYHVLVAANPDAAVDLAARHEGRIHLLVTDVVMPGANGRELRDRLRISRPGLPCLFMSGYTANVIAHHGVLDEGVDFLQKPFTGESLARKVREILDRRPR